MLHKFLKIVKGEASPLELKGGLARGVTLVEILAATAVLAIGLSGIIGLHVATMSAGSRATSWSMASFLAESRSEWLRSLATNEALAVSADTEKLTFDGQTCDESAGDVCYFTRTTTIARNVPITNSFAVSIKIEWQNRALVYDTVVSGMNLGDGA